MDLTDASLEGYVDCTLYEETGTFFPVDENGAPVDELLPPPAPPLLAPRPVTRTATPVEIVHELRAEVASPADESPPSVWSAAAAPVSDTRDSSPAGELAAIGRTPRTRRTRRWLVLATGVPAVAGVALVISLVTSGAARQPSTPSHETEEVAARAPDRTPTAGTSATSGRGENPDQPQERDAVRSSAAASVDLPTNVEGDLDRDSKQEQGTHGSKRVSESASENASESEPRAPIAGSGPCTLVVESTPAGSIVHLDGAPVAPSPITLAASCTRHKIEIKHPRYQNVTKFVMLKEGVPQSIEISLRRPTHTVTVTSQPPGATVYIDGRRAGSTPTVLNVMGFSSVNLEIKKSGYAPVSQSLYSKVPQDKVSVRLTKW